MGNRNYGNYGNYWNYGGIGIMGLWKYGNNKGENEQSNHRFPNLGEFRLPKLGSAFFWKRFSFESGNEQ